MVHSAVTLALVLMGAVSGLGAEALGLPLPFMLGPIAAAGTIATVLPGRLPAGYAFPHWLRLVFITVIGLMIGAQVTPELFSAMRQLALSFAALTLFVGLCFAFNYWVFRRLGRYDRVTAFYCSSPGGLFESLALGEAAGGDVARLTLQQFLRIILVVTTLPVGLSLWLGMPVGSSGGVTLAVHAVPWTELPLIALAGAAGVGLGKGLRLPAGQLTGPMAVAAALSLTGLFHIDMPQWLVNVAQVIIGTALGMRFTGLTRALMLRGAGLSALSVAGMMTFAAGFAALLVPLTGEHFDVLLISFAPGGVTEMALVALSLQSNPALVTLHHIYRILATVVALVATARWLKRGL
ncbi:MAG: AbrB family transcriptional regulator [Roseovarius sp.]